MRYIEQNSGWFKRYVMSFSFKERRAKKLAEYRKKIYELENMKSDEMDFEYITLKSEYEHKKSVLTLFIISIALAVLINIWKYFFMFIEKALQYAASFTGSEIEIVKVSSAIAVIVLFSATFLIVVILITWMKEMHKIQKELLIVEEVRNCKGVSGLGSCKIAEK